MKNNLLLGAFLVLSVQPLAAKTNKSTSEWEVIPVGSEMEIIDDQGNQQTINPACAFDSIADPQGGPPLDNSFHFYFKPGKDKKLVVYFNGGGACWNDATCVSSLALAGVPDARPSYNPSVLQNNSPEGAGGIFDDESKDNPFKDWSKVFIPYCSGDLHVGSNDVVYSDVDGLVTSYPGAPVTVKHRGFDNFLAVKEWLKNNFVQEKGKDKGKDKSKSKSKVKELLVTGSSAGGYGATLNFPHLQSVFPDARASMFADASEAIVTQGFIQDIFSQGTNWNLDQTLHPVFSDALGVYSAYGFNTQIFNQLTQAFPDSRFAQYSTAYDLVQVQFLKISDQLDIGNTNPFTWGLNETDFLYFYEWNIRMQTSLAQLSATTDNYQYYIGAGNIHTILTDAFATEATPHPFYEEESADNVKFSKWLKDFVKSKDFKEQSVAYSD